jgi:hypothetical protein
VGEKQKACRDASCRSKRKQQAQRKWSESNAGYFKGRYWYVKEWRLRKKKMIQDEMPARKPCVEYVLQIPEAVSGMIQDEIILRRVERSTFAAYG